VFELLLTYGPFYKHVTTRGPLPITWCVKQQIHNVWNRKGKTSECVIKIITQYQYITSLYQWDACGRGFSDTIVPLSIPLLVHVGGYRPVFRSGANTFRSKSRGGRLGRSLPLKPKKLSFTMILFNSGNSIRNLRPFCPMFCHISVVKYTSSLLE